MYDTLSASFCSLVAVDGAVRSSGGRRMHQAGVVGAAGAAGVVTVGASASAFDTDGARAGAGAVESAGTVTGDELVSDDVETDVAKGEETAGLVRGTVRNEATDEDEDMAGFSFNGVADGMSDSCSSLSAAVVPIDRGDGRLGLFARGRTPGLSGERLVKSVVLKR